MVLGSGIRKKPIPDPCVEKTPDPGSGSATLLNYCVADPGCVSRIPDPKTAMKDRGEK